jgi:hypothetical protein
MAGYQAGQTSKGNANCYFGAYSGQSNINGNYSCLFGYSSGSSTSGNFNAAFGAYAMQNAVGSSNVAIGAFANASGLNSTNSVFVGTNVAATAEATESVILGSGAGATAHGKGLVILGYNSGSGFRYGDSNILIGTGASTYKSTNTNGISIGSINTQTYNNSISIGSYIANSKDNSVLVGNSLTCDADQSIVLGNTINIQSLQVFQDPLSYPYVASVGVDAKQKLGITNIIYGDGDSSALVYLPTGASYTNATVSVLASNIVNSYNNQQSDSPYYYPNYNLLTSIPNVVSNGYAIFPGSVYPVTSNLPVPNPFPYPTPSMSNVSFNVTSNTSIDNLDGLLSTD